MVMTETTTSEDGYRPAEAGIGIDIGIGDGVGAEGAKSWWLQPRWLIAGGVVLVSTTLIVWAAVGQGGADGPELPKGKATRGPFVVSVTESGEIRAAKQMVIQNPLAYSVNIDTVLEEGTHVQVGEVIIKFLCEELDDAIVSKKEVVESARLEWEKSKQAIGLTEKENASLLAKAKNALVSAGEALEKFEKQDKQLELNDADSELALAKAELALAQQKLAFKKAVNAKEGLEGTYSDSEIEAEELKVERLKFLQTKAETKLAGLTKYDHPKMVRTLGEAVAEATLDLARAEAKAATDKLLADSDLAADTERHQRKGRELAELIEDEAKLTVRAERPGIIVYDSGDRHRRSSQPTIAPGEQVSRYQRLMIIPDMQTLEVASKVFESMIPYVQAYKEGEAAGTPAIIRLDAVRGETFDGYVSWVAKVPTSQWWSSGVKAFPLTVRFNKLPEGLRPNTTAEVELILAEELDDVLSVPVAAVFTEQEQTYCWRDNDGSYERVTIKVGRMNEARVEILDGLDEGDTVLLVPPPGQESKPDGKVKAKKPKTPEAGPKAGPKAGGDQSGGKKKPEGGQRGSGRPERSGGGRSGGGKRSGGGEATSKPARAGGSSRGGRPGGGGGTR